MLRQMALATTDVSEKRIVFITSMTRIGELGTMSPVISNNTIVILRSVLLLLVTVNVPSTAILVTLMMDATYFPKRWFLQDPHGVTSQNTAFFIVIAVKTSNYT
jgi:hypothetical protein